MTITINHNGNSIEEVLGYTSTKELEKEARESELTSDLNMFLACWSTAKEHEIINPIISTLIGRELDTPSKLCEYMVQSVTDKVERSKLIKIMIIDTTVNKLMRSI